MQKVFKTRIILYAIKKIGFIEIRQKGLHLFLEHPDSRTTVIPLHDEIQIGLLNKIIKEDLKMKKEDFETL
ncbi:MAG: type II toxin-antitoxin system HicA family toxin, partial [archaeon]